MQGIIGGSEQELFRNREPAAESIAFNMIEQVLINDQAVVEEIEVPVAEAAPARAHMSRVNS
jgi:hypothetical protein